ncbi:GNAT family N-acetyltransferase [Mucilaginibacter lutimaris]|uniref:GNAT family N-acetyltransferase n=1 Tax=Mucilaginibacter lutimaris TaxID=931629 RepID=A0ABW2ZEB7_9SPHI
MENTSVDFTDKIHAEVRLFSDNVQVGKMNLALTGGRLAVFHTEVDPEFEGRGFAKLLLERLVRYARENDLKIIPLCPYVNAQFTRHPAEYDDVWSKDWHQ